MQWVLQDAAASDQLCVSREPALLPGGAVVPTFIPPKFWSLPTALIIHPLGDFE